MTTILYYSNYCDNSKLLLSNLSKLDTKEIHYVCIDKRIKKNNALYILLKNNQELLLPPTVNKVPALLLLNRGHQVLFEKDIIHYINENFDKTYNSVKKEIVEPECYSISNSFNNIMSDNFSFLDQDSDDLSAKGDGGMRQQYHYATINYKDSIETPPENYQPDKVGNISLDELEKKRTNDIKINK